MCLCRLALCLGNEYAHSMPSNQAARVAASACMEGACYAVLELSSIQGQQQRCGCDESSSGVCFCSGCSTKPGDTVAGPASSTPGMATSVTHSTQVQLQK